MKADLLAQVIAIALAQAPQGSSVRLAELREATPTMRVWEVKLVLDGQPATYRVYSDGQSVSTRVPTE